MNQLSEGPQRHRTPDADGVIERRTPSAQEDLVTEVERAAAARAAGASAAELRAISTLTSRADLRAAAHNERTTVASDPGSRPDPRPSPTGWVARWADLDASEFARLRASTRKDMALDALAANARGVPEYALELARRSPLLARAVMQFNLDLKQQEQARHRQLAPSDTDPRAALQAQARQAHLDAEALARLATRRSEQTRAVVRALAADRQAAETSAVQAEQRAAEMASREEALHAAAQSLGLEPQRGPAPSQVAQAPLPLAATPRTIPTEPLAHHAPGGTARTQPRAQLSPDQVPARSRDTLVKRPLLEEEVPPELKRRYVVAVERRGLLDRGVTAFSFRGGERDGRLAFADVGKQLQTQLDDRDVVRAMVTVAAAKGWREVTVSGSDEFRRAAWLEARLEGLQVHGYEARAVDLKRLAELARDRLPTHAITLAAPQREPSDAAAPPEAQRAREALERPRVLDTPVGARAQPETPAVTGPAPHPASPEPPPLKRAPGASADHDRTASPLPSPSQHDGDALTAKERKVMDGMGALLKDRGYGPEFVAATLAEVENRMRRQRVHLGELLEHGAAPYRGDSTRDMSYFVTLRSAAGIETVWGKELGEALRDGGVRAGDQIVLLNTGKRAVDVPDRTPGIDGQVTGRRRTAERNEWAARPIDRLSTLECEDLARRVGAEPSLQVFDLRAPPQATRSAQKQAPQERAVASDRRPRDPNSREAADRSERDHPVQR